MLVHYKNVQAEMERKLDLSKGTLSKIFNDRVPVTQKFLDYIEERTKRKIPLEEPGVNVPVATAATKTVDDFAAEKTKPNLGKILAAAHAVHNLNDAEQDLLVKLLEFGMSEIPDGIRETIIKLGEITLLKDVLK